ncbi:LacI family DNA-binding transcriptional regulator [Ruminiclostridium cellobioparum]|uniref:LacI family DNA-binding transcriptional regulator n=2 Tax=Ruminiclostridium cellobioparum TaxID=29355 RepID=UPI000484EC77|nr:LacI family DNA-binding transcriptional regulator [Ruminiclostridium cellobioparum]
MGATLDDIAAKVGVSKTTVYRALNGKDRISSDTRDAILAVAKELDYRPNILASGLRSKRSMAIGLIFNDLMAGHFYAEIFHGIEDIATQNNYGVILGCTNGIVEKEKKLINLFIERRVDGIIVSPTHGVDIGCYLRLKKEKIPFVFIDRRIDGIDTDIITTDDFMGAYQATSHFISLGHKKIVLLNGPEYPCSTIEKRIEGYTTALKNNGIKDNKIISLSDKTLDQKKYGYMAIKNYLASGPLDFTAVFAINDSLAIGAYKALVESGARIPEDVAIIGYNDDEMDQYLDVPLTTISQPKYEMGKKSMELLLKRMNDEVVKAGDTYENMVMKPNLIIRKSC